MLFRSGFQNDGEFVGGCIAGGRRYLHINANGDVDPCVFIHYSDSNIREKSLLDCLRSPLFMAYHKGQPFNENHLLPCPMLENPEKLRAMVSFDQLVRPQSKIPADHAYKRHHAPEEMLAAYLSAMGRKRRLAPPTAEAFSGIVAKPVVSVASQIVFVLRSLWKRRRVPFRELFRGKRDSSERIAAFLAVLELVKGRRLRVEGDGDDCEIRLISGGE